MNASTSSTAGSNFVPSYYLQDQSGTVPSGGHGLTLQKAEQMRSDLEKSIPGNPFDVVKGTVRYCIRLNDGFACIREARDDAGVAEIGRTIAVDRSSSVAGIVKIDPI